MRTLPARLIVCLSLASLMACTTMQPVAGSGAGPLTAATVASAVSGGDRLVLTRTDGTVAKMNVTQVLPEALEGTVGEAGGVTRVRFDQIAKVERRSFNGAKTALLVIGIVGIVGLVIQNLVPYSD